MAGRRENGAGTRPKQGANGRWWQQISFTNPETDEPGRTTIRGATEGEVKQKAKEFLKAIENGVKPSTNKVLFQDWLVTWLEVNKKNSVEVGSYDSYECIVNKHMKNSDLGKTELGKVSRSGIQKFINNKAETFSANYTKLMKIIIADALKVAEMDKQILVSPCKGIKLPKVNKKDVTPLTPEDAKRLLAAAEPGSLLHGIIFTALRTGMRRGEVLGLQWDCIDFTAGTITVKQQAKKDNGKIVIGVTKTETSNRVIPLEKKLAEVLKSHKAKQAAEKLALGEAYENNNMVFAEPDGSIIAPVNLSRRFTQLVENTELERCTFHDLRHTFASVAISQRMSIKTISVILGHANISITLDTYGHLLPGDMETVIDTVAAFYDGQN